jgi:hypothetical protein
MWNLLGILVLALIVLLWLDGARARELATAVVDQLCRRRGYQLLDDTVALRRMGIAAGPGGLRLKRLFRFDYSVEGVGRLQGHILLHGTQVTHVDLAEPEALTGAAAREKALGQAATTRDDGKVVPFRRR